MGGARTDRPARHRSGCAPIFASRSASSPADRCRPGAPLTGVTAAKAASRSHSTGSGQTPACRRSKGGQDAIGEPIPAKPGEPKGRSAKFKQPCRKLGESRRFFEPQDPLVLLRTGFVGWNPGKPGINRLGHVIVMCAVHKSLIRLGSLAPAMLGLHGSSRSPDHSANLQNGPCSRVPGAFAVDAPGKDATRHTFAGSKRQLAH
jgi:hypothetical protein